MEEAKASSASDDKVVAVTLEELNEIQPQRCETIYAVCSTYCTLCYSIYNSMMLSTLLI